MTDSGKTTPQLTERVAGGADPARIDPDHRRVLYRR
ncbi:Uncharacterised protein [Raoultella terrigena]|uniref:Uncharacterized protein n=1 Tax=Raoultella terrigena TaxID=577 RepID=A0A4U9D7X1_RAOTE|nr:Uncharacterised protein [Raoultella terrigena]